MRIPAIVSAFVITTAAIALAEGNASAAPEGAKVSGTPSHASTKGLTSRSNVAAGKGANRSGFCPPVRIPTIAARQTD